MPVRRLIALVLVALLLVVGLFVAGCSSSGHGPGAAGPGAAGRASTTTAPVEGDAGSGGAGADGSATTPTSAVDSPLYHVSQPVPDGPLGQVLSSEPMSAPLGATAWRVLYRSRAVDGRPIAVSGMIVRPAGRPPAGGWPVISWAHGTTGTADSCAPSRQGVGTIDNLDALLKAGYVVAATDYEGLGTPGPHPYLVGASEGRSVLDAARAARALVPAATGGVAIWGHSQGGQAALWAGELAADYAPELKVAGVAAFAPAARFASFMSDTATPLLAGFEVAAAAGLAAVHPELHLNDVLNAEALSKIGVLETGCIAEVVVTFAVIQGGVLVPGGLQRPDWQAAIAANEAGAHRSVPPVLVLQGQNDTLIRPAVADQYRQAACGVGSSVDVRLYPGADHGSVLMAGRSDALSWTSDRLAGRALRAAC